MAVIAALSQVALSAETERVEQPVARKPLSIQELHDQFAKERSEQAEVSKLLYPATKTWASISEAPTISLVKLNEIRERLRLTYKSTKFEGNFLEGADCSFIDRALDEKNTSSFHSIDIDGDGVLDIVYTGSAECAEGDVTLVWFGTNDGYAITQSVLWPMRALRVAPDYKTISSISIGCCGDPVDEYYLGNLKNMRQLSRTRIAKATVLPKPMLDKVLSFRNVGSTTLRSAPEKENRYNKTRSEFMAHAVFGNVLRRYLPHASGLVLASQIDSAGKKWFFVVLDEESDALLLEGPYAINAGWTDQVNLVKTTSRCKQFQEVDRSCEKIRAGRIP